MGRGFRDLKIWQKSFDLVIKIYEITRKFPNDERFGLTDQIKRAANSVAANIAEAHGRYHYADKCRVLFVARGECEEVRSHMSIALGLKYLSLPDFNYLDEEYNGLEVGINSFISSLKDSA